MIYHSLFCFVFSVRFNDYKVKNTVDRDGKIGWGWNKWRLKATPHDYAKTEDRERIMIDWEGLLLDFNYLIILMRLYVVWTHSISISVYIVVFGAKVIKYLDFQRSSFNGVSLG